MTQEWEQEFEASIGRERECVIELLDAARVMDGAFRPVGVDKADAADYFAKKFEEWRQAADAVTRLAENYLSQR
jgi:hypothetical protein